MTINQGQNGCQDAAADQFGNISSCKITEVKNNGEFGQWVSTWMADSRSSVV